MARVFSGVQPSGAPHLGNYLGAWSRWAREQEEGHFYCIVDLHAITMPHDPAVLQERTIDLACWLLACGIDPDVATLFVQSHVREHSECTWILNCVASMGELQRMVQFKEKSEGREFVSVGLFAYPVLQAADILLYHAEEVPVGEDQRQHVELARDIAQRFNHRFGEVFTLPKAVHPLAGARVMDLQDPTVKMSKSAASDKGIIYVLDEPARIAKKIRSAVTDSAGDIRHDRDAKPGVSNLLEILAAATGGEVDRLAEEYDGGGYGAFKAAVAEAVVELLLPTQQRYAELAGDPGEVERILAAGADRARAIAAPTLARAKDAIGLLPPPARPA